MSRTTPRPVGVAVAALLAGVTLAACSADGPPAGWREVEQGALALAVPEEWVTVELPNPGIYDLVLQDSETEPTVQLAAASTYGADDGRTTLAVVRIQAAFGELDSDGTISEVDPDRGLWRWDVTYDGGMSAVSWAVHQAGSDRTAVVTLTGEELAEETVEEIQDSIQLVPES